MTGEAGGSRNTGTIPIKLESGTRILEERLETIILVHKLVNCVIKIELQDQKV